jgi:surfeit locus 1 family protein
VQDIIRNAQTNPIFGGRPDPTPLHGSFNKAWNFVNLPTIAEQIPCLILLVHIQESPETAGNSFPIPAQQEIGITSGPHLSYAVQWFTFAAVLLLGYPVFVSRHELPPSN